MKVIRTRIVVALASSVVLASGFGLTAVAVSSAGSATTTLAASQHPAGTCSNTTVIDYCAKK
jgi:hypothetical protein